MRGKWNKRHEKSDILVIRKKIKNVKITVDKPCIQWYSIRVASERSRRDHKAVKKK